ncbi:MAG TPA: PDC sensor domain-containing protein [Thermoanaerobaculia bacterium]|nr:PDC sensor domain-containing protein [Thermoanaerobaculia bacterium]
MRKLLLVLAFAAPALGQSAETVQKLLASEAAKLRALGSDPAIVAAVKAQNAKKATLDAIKALDGQWTAGKTEAMVKQMTTGRCADRLREFAAANAAYGETFVMDDRGALVCATAKTSDYWQGDEAKWQRAFKGGKGDVFIDRPKFDESAGARIAQISVPVMENDRAIGAITVGVAIEKLAR